MADIINGPDLKIDYKVKKPDNYKKPDAEKKRRVWSTDLINQVIDDYNNGYDIDYSPFFWNDIELRAENVSYDYTNEEVEEFDKCLNDPVYFIEKYCKFMTDFGQKSVKLRDYQKELIRLVTAQEYNSKLNLLVPKNRSFIWCASRQVGKTTTMASIFAYLLVFSKDKNYMLLANKEQTVIEIADKIIQVFRGLPYFLKPGCKSFGKKGFKLDNNCRIITGATTKTTSIGFTVHLLYLDEFAHIDPNIVNSFWRSVYPTLSSSMVSQCMITSTPNGVDNKFYEIWSKSLNNENNFVNYRTDYWQVPEHDDKWVEDQIKDFGEEEFAQEFALQFNVASKMLLKGSDLGFLNNMCVPYVHKPLFYNSSYLQSEKIKWHPKFDPNNIDPNDRFILLVDIADGGEDPEIINKKKGAKTPDSNTIQILKMIPNSIANIRKYKEEGVTLKDVVRFVQVGTFEDNETDETFCAGVTMGLALDVFKSATYDNCRVMVEMNFQGKNYVTHCQKHPLYYDDLLQRTYHNKPIPGEVRRRRIGFKSGPEKNQFCSIGSKLINTRRIIPTDRKTYIQLESFGYVKGKLKGIACHDDLAYPMVNHIPVMMDDVTFISWIEDFIRTLPDENKKYQINQYIQQWDLDNPEMSDSEFNSMYGVGQSSFGGDMNSLFNNAQNLSNAGVGSNPYTDNPYNSLYNSGGSQNPYSNQGGIGGMINPYSGR